MKVTVNDLYAISPPGAPSDPVLEAYKDGLPWEVSMAIKRLMDSVAAELVVANPERTKLLEQYGKLNKEKTSYDLPKFGTKKFNEWNKEITGFGNKPVDIVYEPIDLDKLAGDMGNKIIKGDFISIVDSLNKVYEQEEEAKAVKEKDGTDKGEPKD